MRLLGKSSVCSLSLQEAQAYAEENNLYFMETSAKTATNVNGAFVNSLSRLHRGSPPNAELFYEIARKLPKTAPAAPSTGGLVLTDKAPAKRGKSACCA